LVYRDDAYEGGATADIADTYRPRKRRYIESAPLTTTHVPSVVSTSSSSSSAPSVVRVGNLRKRGYSELPDDDDIPAVTAYAEGYDHPEPQHVALLAGLRNIVRPPEIKHKLSENINWMDNQGTSWLLLNGIAVGSTSTTRVGRRIHMKSIQLSLHVYMNPNEWGIHEGIRGTFWLIYDRQSNGAAPTATTFLDTSLVYASQEFPNEDYKDRYLVLMHRVFTTGPIYYDNANAMISFASPQNFSVDTFKKLDLITQYGGDTNAIASIATGSLYAFTIGDYQAPDPYLECSITAKLKYTE